MITLKIFTIASVLVIFYFKQKNTDALKAFTLLAIIALFFFSKSSDDFNQDEKIKAAALSEENTLSKKDVASKQQISINFSGLQLRVD
ncbi:hypothetical protein [Pedobacter sp. MW01-1-1]|uniref:hypothetical protein n=1 Tax=Pedobacter sp. MW01-1-1 TaxID=3383027 RepID=UPI003FED8D12